MKKELIIIVIFLISTTSIASAFSIGQQKQSMYLNEIQWMEHQLDLTFGYAGGLICFDLDDDGDSDVLAAAIHNNEVAWWENDGNQPPVWVKHTVDSNFIGAIYVQAADIDADGDNDIVGAAWDSGEVVWWCNQGGSPISWSKQIIRTGFVDAHELYVVDIDADADVDILGASAGLNQIVLWRNNGDNPVTWSEEVISSDVPGARSMMAGDLDNDGDLDIVGAAFVTDEILYWLNDGGSPVVWTEYTISSICNGAHHIVVYDIDYDGDVDVFCCAAIGNQIVLWINEGGSPLQWTRKVPGMFFSGALRVSVGDVDLDGDDDIIGSAYTDHDVCWWDREGTNPIDWVEREIDGFCHGAWALDVCDIDSDGDLDVFAGATGGISWYENLLLPMGDLKCSGSLSWSEVPAGSVVSDSFSVENVGVNVSRLDWAVIEWPDWGSWSFDPNNGTGLSPDEGVLTVTVEVVVPEEKNADFSGKIRIVNCHDASDFEEVSVSLSTPQMSRTLLVGFFDLLISFCKELWIFQLLESILGL